MESWQLVFSTLGIASPPACLGMPLLSIAATLSFGSFGSELISGRSNLFASGGCHVTNVLLYSYFQSPLGLLLLRQALVLQLRQHQLPYVMLNRFIFASILTFSNSLCAFFVPP